MTLDILLVDENSADVSKKIAHVFNGTVHTANTQEDAAEELGKRNYELMIVDRNLPGLNVDELKDGLYRKVPAGEHVGYSMKGGEIKIKGPSMQYVGHSRNFGEDGTFAWSGTINPRARIDFELKDYHTFFNF